MPIGTPRGSTKRKPAKSSRPDKMTEIRTKRDSEQSLKRLKKEITNQALYGRPVSEVIQAVVDGYTDAEKIMQD